ncbi:MAG TPA: isochorismatase family protein [Trueperaceae bacterium]
MEIRRWASVLSEDDIAAFEKGGFGRRMGFGSKPALLVVDMTKLFVDPKYPNAYGDRAEQALEAYRELLGVSRELRLPIFFSRRDSRRTEVERGVTALKWGHTEDPLWLVDPEADEWPESIEPRDGEYVIRKSKPSAFFETPLRSQLAYLGVDTLIVGGVSTSGCVRAAVTDAFSCNLRVIVPEECCADRSSLSHAVSLIDMDMKFADVMPLAEVVSELRKTVLTTSLSK